MKHVPNTNFSKAPQMALFKQPCGPRRPTKHDDLPSELATRAHPAEISMVARQLDLQFDLGISEETGAIRFDFADLVAAAGQTRRHGDNGPNAGSNLN